MHVITSLLEETHIEWIAKTYGIPLDLHPRPVPAEMTMDELPDDAIGLYLHHFKEGGLRIHFSAFFLGVMSILGAAPIAIPWRHNDSSVVDPPPTYGEYDEDEVEKLREHAGHEFLLKDPDRKGNTLSFVIVRSCEISCGDPLPEGAVHVTHTTPSAARLEDVPKKTKLTELAEKTCAKVLADKEKKKEKSALKAAQKAVQQVGSPRKTMKATGKRAAEEGGSSKPKKKQAHKEPSSAVVLVSDHVSFPTPINQAQQLNTLTNAPHGSDNASNTLMDILREQTIKNSDENIVNDDDAYENAGGKAVHTHEPAGEAESTFTKRFDDRPFAPQWGLTKSSWMYTATNCRDMLKNLFTPADYEFMNEGVSDHQALQRSRHQLGQCVQTQANMLLRFEALLDDFVDLHHVHESFKDIHLRYDESKKDLAKLRTDHEEKVGAHDLLLKDYNYDVNVEEGLHERIEELEREKKEWLKVGKEQVNRIKKLEAYLAYSEKEAHQLQKERGFHG
ncbi:hypothetical protein Tco_0703885 [Tanacetum coccineum]|uniref:Uncharacterized protein n=1 Tax=Tanacetum coccineum TaxID=301880 RepID=A0ABQ4Y0M9_9ASTR